VSSHFDSERTDYFRCEDGEILAKKNLKGYQYFPGMEIIQHHCVDFDDGRAIYVRGTYSMVTCCPFVFIYIYR
jgi:hypothetical protein